MAKKILLVEDEAIIAMSEAQLLKRHGYEVVTAHNGERAIEAVDADPEISLILMDINLGSGMDGTEAAAQILTRHDIPTVFVTSHSEKEYVDRVKKITGYGYVLKNSGEFVLIESIHMAYSLFEANEKLKTENSARRETEEELSSIYTHTPVLMLLLDKERRVRKANAFATQFAGTPAEDMIGKRGGEALRCIHHLDNPKGCGFGPFCKECSVKQVVKNTFANGEGYHRVEATLPFIQHGEEQQLTFLVSTSLLHKKEEDLCLVAFEDITDYKQLQEKYKALFDNAPLPYQSLDRNGIFLGVNPAWLETLGGYTQEEVIGASFAEFLHPDSVDGFRTNFEKLKEHGSGKGIVYRMRKKSGDSMEVSFDGVVAYTAGGDVKQTHCILKDVTEETRIKRELQESEKRFKTIVEHINQGLIIHDFDGIITFVNDKVCRALGYSQDELIGKSVAGLHSHSHRNFVQNVLENAASPDGDSFEIEALSKDGKVIPVEVRSKIVSREGAGEIQSVVTDITKRKLAEQALSQSEMTLRQVIDLVPHFIFAKDAHGNYLLANKAVADVHGTTPERLLGRSDYDFSRNTEEVDFFVACDRKVIESGTGLYNIEEPITDSDGSIRYLETTKIPFTASTNGIPAVLAVSIDITERKQAEQALDRERTLLRTIIDSIPDPIYVKDIDGGIQLANRADYQHSGFEREEDVIGKTDSDIYPPEIAKRFVEDDQRVLIHGQSVIDREEQLITRNGEVVWQLTTKLPLYDRDGKITGLVGIGHDITERKQAEERLRQVLNEYDTVFHGTRDIMFLIEVIDEDTYRFIRNNRAHAEATGFTTEWIQKKTPQELLGEERGAEIAANCRRCVRASSSISFEETVNTPGGLRTWYVTVTPVFNQSRIQYLVGAAQDITERKQAAEEIQRQLAEKETLLKEVHHRMKNNMAQVEGLLSLQAGSADSAEVKSALNEAISRVRSTRTLYDKLLIGERYEEVSMRDYLEGLIDSLLEVFNERCGVTVEQSIVEFTLCSRKAVPVGIILNELLTNAFKYAFKGRDEGRVSIGLEKTEKRVTLSVWDDGIGIDEGVDANNTSGFGLSLVKMLAEQLEGVFSIANDHGTRSVLEFEI
ncbi:MAG: PAS domain S-box protein [Spirochaetaceae bacterium]|nr:MAG: PAS domain S-box protein [Spirochaetaceae bacterium]